MPAGECFDVTIIGGGPSGLYSAFYSGLREMKTKLIEAQPHLGGKIHVYPEKTIGDVGGVPPITGAKLIEQLIEQGMTFNPEVVLNEKILSISREDSGEFVLKADSGQVHYSKTLIIATGSGILKPQKLKIEGAEKFEVSNLHYTVPSLNQFINKRVIISGGGNSAIDWANEIEPFAEQVYLTFRKADLEGHESQISRLKNSTVECLPHTSITKLMTGKHQEAIKYVELTNQKTGGLHRLTVDDVIINHGFHQDAALLSESGMDLELVDQCYIAGNATSEILFRVCMQLGIS